MHLGGLKTLERIEVISLKGFRMFDGINDQSTLAGTTL